MKIFVIGAGGVGGAIGGFLASNGNNVTFIARGKHMNVIVDKGLSIKSDIKGDLLIKNIKAYESDKIFEKADIVFVCVKEYSLNEAIPIIKKLCHDDTIVVPVLNTIGVGNKIASRLKDVLVTDGCIYITAYLSEPGKIVQNGNIFKIVFGERKDQSIPIERLNMVKGLLDSCGIKGVISDNIERDVLQKFSFISSFAACGIYYNITAKDMQKEGVYRSTFIELIKEIIEISNAMGIKFEIDILKENLRICDSLQPDITSSTQKDINMDKPSEIDGLIFEVVRLGQRLGVETPTYLKAAKAMGYN